MGKKASKFQYHLQSEIMISDEKHKGFTDLDLTCDLELDLTSEKDSSSFQDNQIVSSDYLELKKRFENYWEINHPKGEITASGIQLSNKGTFFGEWAEGQKNGHGVLRYNDGSILEGYWSLNKLIGSALLVKGKIVYFGPLVKGKAEGLGVKRFKGIEIEGFWHLGKLEGQGKETWPNGSSFCGLYSKGCKNGKGVFLTPRNRFSGEFKDNLFDGFGELQSTDGRNYKGTWKQGLPHGTGTLRYSSGCIFKGEFSYGKRSGSGEFIWPNGCRYSGEFFNDDLHGTGKYFYTDGSCFEGFWKLGQKQGFGRISKSNGKIIQGLWQDGVFRGFLKDSQVSQLVF